MSGEQVRGPRFDELTHGQVFDAAPAFTLTSGLAAAHQAITGSRLRLPLDATLCAEVTGTDLLADPALVWNVAIGQSTLATQQVRANLFYRGLVLYRQPVVGDTMRTVTTVEALRQNASGPTGLAVLRVTTIDQHDRPVLDFWRCAMLPRDGETSHHDDIDAVGQDANEETLAHATAGWRLERFRDRVPGSHLVDLHTGQAFSVDSGDVVTGAPELARLTLNVAAVHHDPGSGDRLVYGGHTIAIALAQATRALPNLVTVAGWQHCEHLAPVREGDVLRSNVVVRAVHPIESGGLAQLHSTVTTADGTAVLDWLFTALFA